MKPIVIADASLVAGNLLFLAMIFGTPWMWIRYRRQRRVAAHAPAEQQYIWHGEFMRALIQTVGHDTAARKSVMAIPRVSGFLGSEGAVVIVGAWSARDVGLGV